MKKIFSCIRDGLIPSSRINAFISSAMKDEKDVNWLDIRKKVCNILKRCPYINPFTIEEHVSEIPSSNFFMFKVKQCDILILMIKEEIRAGVRQEIEVARKDGKAIILYFYKYADSKSDAYKLKCELEDADYCTRKLIENFDNIEEIILNDLMCDIIDTYNYHHFLTSQNQIYSNSLISIPNANNNETDSYITKNTLQYFESCYGVLSNELGFSFNDDGNDKEHNLSLFHTFGIKILKWIFHGEDFVNQDEITTFIEKIKIIYKDSEWIKYRWNAINCYISNEISAALINEEIALETARRDLAPEWIIGDILIDCRNLESETKLFNLSGKYQKELNDRNEIIYVPISDRSVSETYAKLLDEEIKLSTSLPGTKHFGGNIIYVLKDIENYVFISLIYGSYTHLYKARDLLTKILYKYGKIYNDSDLKYSAVKLMILSADVQTLKNLMLKEWDDLYYYLTTNAEELWSISNYINNKSKLNIKLILIRYLGMYFNDNLFAEVRKYLIEISNVIIWNDAEHYLNSILSNISRIIPEEVAEMLINILNRNQLNLGSSISNILLRLNTNEVSIGLLEKLNKLIESNLKSILERNGTPQFVAHLVHENPKIFSNLELLLPDNMEQLEKIIYNINVGKCENWSDIILHSIKEAEIQVKLNTESNVVIGFGINPFKIIQEVINKNLIDDDKIIEVLQEKFVQLAINVLVSNVQRSTKEDCINCLIDVIIIFNHNNIPIDLILLDTIRSFEFNNESSFDPFENTTNITLKYRLIMLKTISGFDVKNEILNSYLSFANKQDMERFVLAQCINQYLQFYIKNNKEIEEIFLLVTIELCNDTYFLVRKEAIFCLITLLGTKYFEVAKQKLIELSTDTSPNVKGEILNLIDKIEDKDLCNEILEFSINDANYGIRRKVEDLNINNK